MSILNIDDDEHVDWLHHPITRFLVFKKGKDVGMLDIKDQQIRTQDERLKELFYVYMDEGIDGEDVAPDADGSSRVQQALELEGYEVQPDEENTQQAQAEDEFVKLTKSEVEYEDPARGMDHCKACKHFDSTAKNCALVAGSIAPDAWCKKFERVTVIHYQGLAIHCEQLRGEVRHGALFHQRMTIPYGYIRKTEGADGDAVDAFVGPLANAPFVYVIHTRNRAGEYDEDKCMLGFESALEAQEAFLENYDSPFFFDSMEKFTMADFKEKLKSMRGRKITALDKSIEVPADHEIGMEVPAGGSNCDKCEYLHDRKKLLCGQENFIAAKTKSKAAGDDKIPAPYGDLSRYCCDFFEEKEEK